MQSHAAAMGNIWQDAPRRLEKHCPRNRRAFSGRMFKLTATRANQLLVRSGSGSPRRLFRDRQLSGKARHRHDVASNNKRTEMSSAVVFPSTCAATWRRWFTGSPPHDAAPASKGPDAGQAQHNPRQDGELTAVGARSNVWCDSGAVGVLPQYRPRLTPAFRTSTSLVFPG